MSRLPKQLSPSATTDRRADNDLTSASGAARSVHAQTAELLTTSLQALKQRAHQLLESQRSLQQQNQALATERLGLQSERDQLAAQHQEHSAERDALQAERDSLTTQLEAITAQRDNFQQERDGLQSERDQLTNQHQELSAERDALQAERDSLTTQLETITAHRDSIQQERDGLQSERDQLDAQHQEHSAERDALQAERDRLTTQCQEKVLIRSFLKHTYRELGGQLANQSAIKNFHESQEADEHTIVRKLVKTIGSTEDICKNEAHRFAMEHAICHFKSNTVCSFIPKNACTNLRYSLAIANGAIRGEEDFHWIHENNHACRVSGEKEALLAHYTFTILRNPFTRLVSFFCDKLAGEATYETDGSYKQARGLFPLAAEELTFRSFINYLWDFPHKLNEDHHIRPQVDFLLYEDYDNWFCVEKLQEAVCQIKMKAGFELLDTRQLSGHTSNALHEITDKTLPDMNITQIKDLKSRGHKPCPLSIYDQELAFKANALYLSDVMLYSGRFGVKDGIGAWLSLSRAYACLS